MTARWWFSTWRQRGLEPLLRVGAQRRSVQETAHRPWPLPAGPWFIAQSWLNLAFLHWPVSHAELRPLIPGELELDAFDGQCWVGIVPFRMSTVRFAGCPPVLGTSAFPEVNVRTYVVQAGKPGVFFLSLDAGNPVAIAIGRRLFGLPYLRARVQLRAGRESVRFRSDRSGPAAPLASFAAIYGPEGPPCVAPTGTLEHWLTERYCFYTATHAGISRTEIHHLPWELQPARLNLQENSLLDPFRLSPRSSQPLTHYSAAQHVVAWRPASDARGVA